MLILLTKLVRILNNRVAFSSMITYLLYNEVDLIF